MAENKEFVRANEFNKMIKNPLREYYSYGFKDADISASDNQWREMKDSWNFLTAILKDYMEWSVKREDMNGQSHRKSLKTALKKNGMFANVESEMLPINPMHKLYRYALGEKNYVFFFMHMLAAMSDKIDLRIMEDKEGFGSIDEVLELRKCLVKKQGDIEERYCDPKEKDFNEIERLDKDDKDEPWTTADLMCFYSLGKYLFSGDNATHNNRLQKMEDIGLLCDERLRDTNNRKWKCSGVTLGGILEKGEKNGENFKERFRLALQFFSMYFPLGEIGTRILDRMGNNPESPFRFRHAYFMQAVYDFNLIDLLKAIDEHKWCRIYYMHGTKKSDNYILCCPLQVRISVSNGRMHLMEYEPLDRACKSIRVDFIESIEYYTKKQICDILNVSANQLDADVRMAEHVKDYAWGVSTGSNPRGNSASKLKQAEYKVEISKACAALGKKSKETLKNELERLKEVKAIEEIDGCLKVTVSNLKSLNDVSSTLKECQPVLLSEEYEDDEIRKQHVEFVIKDNPEAVNRLKREARRGTVAEINREFSYEKGYRFEVDVLDPGEMRPWVRSFYGDLVSVEGISEDSNFRMADDISKMKAQKLPVIRQKTVDYFWSIPFDCEGKLNAMSGKAKAREHEMLFQEMFSIYYYVATEIFTRICALGDKEPITEEKFNNIKNDVREEYGFMMGGESDEWMKKFTFKEWKKTKWQFLKGVDNPNNANNFREYYSKYRCEKPVSFYRDIVPLSDLEIRWLLSAMKDPYFSWFLEEEEINTMEQALLAEEASREALSLDKIYYYDKPLILLENDSNKPLVLSENGDREKKIFQRLLSAIMGQCNVCLDVNSIVGEVSRKVYHPILIQYSNKLNEFRVFLQSAGDDYEEGLQLAGDLGQEIQSLSFAEIRNVEIEENTKFNMKAARDALASFQEKTLESVEIEFTEERGTVDRILSEFSPWKKKCTYDEEETGHYFLTIYYHQGEEIELENRLIGYGSSIKIMKEGEKEHVIYQMIKKQLVGWKQVPKSRDKTI